MDRVERSNSSAAQQRLRNQRPDKAEKQNVRAVRIHKYLPMAMIYFFVNAPAVLPLGLLITGILSPLFYFWLLLKKRRFVLEGYCAALFPFFVMNVVDGIQWHDFAGSAILLLSAYVTIFAFGVAIREALHLDRLIETLIWMNLALAVVGAVVRFSPWPQLMWQVPTDVDPFRVIRYKAFTYEASYYSTLLAPLVLYSYWKLQATRSVRAICLMVATVLPLLMSLSYGSIGSLIVSLAAVHLAFGTGVQRFKWIAIGVAIAALVMFAMPDQSAIRQRAINIVTGKDDSEQIRTTDALVSAYRMADSKDLLFGIGLGEIKDYGIQYMNLNQGVIPSAVAETLATFGVLGLILRFGMEFYLFWRTRPYEDPFRLSLFIWVFLFQFGGSFNGNVAEYVIWLLAFSPSVGFFPRTRMTAKQTKLLPRGLWPESDRGRSAATVTGV